MTAAIPERFVFNWLFRLLTKQERHDWMALVVARLVSKQVRAIRIQRGLTQARLAELSGVSVARISYIERWWSLKITLRTLNRITNALDCALSVRFEDWFDFLEMRKLDPERLIPAFDSDALRSAALGDTATTNPPKP